MGILDDLLKPNKENPDMVKEEYVGTLEGYWVSVQASRNFESTDSGGTPPSSGYSGEAPAGLLQWPAPGVSVITSRFGATEASRMKLHEGDPNYTGHKGLDIGCPTGSTIVAAEDGVVIFAGWTDGSGNKVKIQHDSGWCNGMSTGYLHLSSYSVAAGQRVNKGQPIAKSGNTGKFTTGPHLHFEVQYRGSMVDPQKYLQG